MTSVSADAAIRDFEPKCKWPTPPETMRGAGISCRVPIGSSSTTAGVPSVAPQADTRSTVNINAVRPK